jgi:hypothetical protein
MIDMAHAAALLRAQFGEITGEAYVTGKTLFRDALCDSYALSQLDAEDLCDSLEKAGLILFADTDEHGPVWMIRSEADEARRPWPPM